MYGRLNALPSLTVNSFSHALRLFDDDDDSGRQKRSTKSRNRINGALIELGFDERLRQGTWYISFYNDNDEALQLSLEVAQLEDDDASSQCPNACSGRGQCRSDGECVCADGFDGIDCSEQQRCPLLCSGQGRYERGRCRCYAGWRGAECDVRGGSGEERPCARKCNGRGLCRGGLCFCRNGWTGSTCRVRAVVARSDDIDSAYGSSEPPATVMAPAFERAANCSPLCDLNGRCLPSGECRCRDGWNGKWCTIGECEKSLSTAM